MKESMWGYLIVILGVVILAVLLLVQRLTTTNEEDYYLSREVLKAAMLDAVDYGSYMKTGKLVMSREKFVAVFTRRFADSVTPDKDYRIDFYDIYEYPPKATIRISTSTGETTIKDDSVNVEINTFITGILETTDDGGLFTSFYNIDGDVDGNGTTTIGDSRLVVSYALKGTWPSGVVNTNKADVNSDGRVDYVDASIIERAILSKYKQGDVNMDGKIDQNDVDYLKQNAAMSREVKILSDVNCDGKNNNDDLKYLQEYVDGKRSSFPGVPVRGDVNGDGRVGALDLEILYNYINDRTTLNKGEHNRADYNQDGKVDINDLKALATAIIDGKYSYK